MPSRGAAHAHPCLPFLCQINNYLTVPAHKLDSPTMSRARIGSGKAGRRVLGEGPQGWAHSATISRMRLQQEWASESPRGGRAAPSLTSQAPPTSGRVGGSPKGAEEWPCCPPQGQSVPRGAHAVEPGAWQGGRGQLHRWDHQHVGKTRAGLPGPGDSGGSLNSWSEEGLLWKPQG